MKTRTAQTSIILGQGRERLPTYQGGTPDLPMSSRIGGRTGLRPVLAETGALPTYRLTLFLIAILLVGAASGLHAQELKATARVDSNNILIGDWLQLHLDVQHTSDVTVSFPQLADSLQGLEIVRRAGPVVQKNGDQVLESETFTITAFDSGMFIVPPLVVQYVKAGDTTKLTAQTSAIPIFVHSVAVDTTKDIKDVKPPLSVPITFADVLPYLIALAVIAALVWLILYVRKKRRRGESLIPEAPARPAHELALEALRSLESENLWQRGKVKEYHSQLTEIVRLYIERRFDVRALEMTSDEILDGLADMNPDVREPLKDILFRADFVKFAKYQPLPDENESSIRRAVSFVESTWRDSVRAAEPQETPAPEGAAV